MLSKFQSFENIAKQVLENAFLKLLFKALAKPRRFYLIDNNDLEAWVK